MLCVLKNVKQKTTLNNPNTVGRKLAWNQLESATLYITRFY